MGTRAPFLTTAYGGYLHNEVPEADEELTHVGPGTPCGEYLRRFWHPVVRSDELKDLPVRIRILGEDLVVFRDQSGRVGLLELHCPHRGTSLEFGIICETGIRCCYHFWRIDVDGKKQIGVPFIGNLASFFQGYERIVRPREDYLITITGFQNFFQSLGNF